MTMGSHSSLERRDPAAGVLELGRVLATARRDSRSGQIEIRDGGRVHAVQVAAGAISEVSLDENRNQSSECGPYALMSQAKRLFGLQRPHVLWFPGSAKHGASSKIDPASVVVLGVAKRPDLFNPRPLIDRIPVDMLRVDPSKASVVKHLPLKNDELAFLDRLTVATPVSMILWKRGLEPERAAVLLVAFNLIGLFEGEWEPGDLPRLTAAVRLSRRIKSGCSDRELLGIRESASAADADRAFRMLSLELHPDRLAGFPAKERAAAKSAYQAVSAAYERIRRSRRSRPAMENHACEIDAREAVAERFASLAAEAEAAARRGECARARAYALKVLALDPPQKTKIAMRSILTRAA